MDRSRGLAQVTFLLLALSRADRPLPDNQNTQLNGRDGSSAERPARLTSIRKGNDLVWDGGVAAAQALKLGLRSKRTLLIGVDLARRNLCHANSADLPTAQAADLRQL